MDKHAPSSSVTQQETRKLAAVMFADIEGYTALFEKHEDAALTQLNIHRHDLQHLAREHHGRIIKYYGDGSLTLFTSIIEAIHCAVDLQRTSMVHAIPLRIGIHLGELVEKENDVYGDAVNIASRVQACGLPGSVLVSQTVANELKNHPGIELHSLGRYELKNVRRPIGLFAVNAPGIIVPQTLHIPRHLHSRRPYYWIGSLVLFGVLAFFLKNTLFPRMRFHSEDCFIIPPFTPHVNHPDFAYFPQTIASYIGKHLHESAGVDIINERTLSYFTNANIAKAGFSPSVARKAGARYEIRGNFTLEGIGLDTLRIWMEIIDVRTNASLPISIPDITCLAANKMDCVRDASNLLAGYWRSAKDHVFHFTNDSAYTAYLIAQQKWGDANASASIHQYLLKAIRHDPKFIDAWFLLLDYFYNEEAFAAGKDTIAVIRSNFPALDDRERNYLNYYEADFNGKSKKAFDHFYKEYQHNKKDLFINTSGMVMAMEYLNDPALAIDLFNDIPADSFDLSMCSYCLTRINIALQAYTNLDQLDKANVMATRLLPYASRLSEFARLIDYYVQIRDTLGVNEVIQKSLSTSTRYDDEQYYCLLAARAAAIRNDIALRDQYARRAIQRYGDTVEYALARLHLLIGNLDEAKFGFNKLIERKPNDYRYYGLLGIVHARQGDSLQARLMMEKIGPMESMYTGETTYMQARIAANLGNKPLALSLCKKALDEGLKFRPSITFRQDPEMLILHTDPDFIALEKSLRFTL